MSCNSYEEGTCCQPALKDIHYFLENKEESKRKDSHFYKHHLTNNTINMKYVSLISTHFIWNLHRFINIWRDKHDHSQFKSKCDKYFDKYSTFFKFSKTSYLNLTSSRASTCHFERIDLPYELQLSIRKTKTLGKWAVELVHCSEYLALVLNVCSSGQDSFHSRVFPLPTIKLRAHNSVFVL
jgi:hypothetical protein